MAEKKKLNVDVSRAISDFETVAKEFELKEKLYKIIFRGKGLEFDSYRDYAPDDDASMIDWKASKRANKTLIKRYVEERDLNIIFVIDVGENMVLGSADKLKCEYAAELVSAFSHLIITSNDKVGFVLYSDDIKDYIPPRKGLNHLYFLVDILSDPSLYGGASRLDKALDFLLENLDESINFVVFVSDFTRINENIEKDLFFDFA